MKYQLPRKPDAVLFDLDGTLIDSAPDLAGAVNALRTARGMAEIPYELLRPYASQGARGLIGQGFGIAPEHADFEALKNEFLDYYEANSCVRTCLFDGVEDMLQYLESRQIPWGIITNKHARFTEPLVEQLGFTHRAAVIVSGDTTAHAKPHPAPMYYAADVMGVDAANCVYIGDDERDIAAAHAAGYMSAIAVAYGYGALKEIKDWHASACVMTAVELLALLRSGNDG
ncbi:MAG: phosphoglycolate phosphatase [Formosimonas sp.]|jgi:2-phosphoglycolate phosphatase